VSLDLGQVVKLLDLEELEVNIFRGYSPREERERAFGGQVAAQALVAATRTVPDDRVVHSLHSYFLRPGDVMAPIVYFVDRIRDGKSFTTRRVVAIQHGEAIFNLSASFQRPEPGVEHHLPMPSVVDPETLPTMQDRLRAMYGANVPERIIRERPVDIRWADPPPGWRPKKGGEPRGMVWMRADGKLPDDPHVHVAVLVYATDFTLTETVMRPHGIHWLDKGVMTASLDHCVWIHREVKADEWWLYVQDSPSAGGARGLARGSIFDRQGQLVASVAQEVLLRTPQA
jgi:acyl-CoA thioesterase-2